MPGDLTHLYGRDRAMELVREFLRRPERGGVPRSRRVPVIVFTGGRGSGKTALLAELADRLDSKVPFARIDCETMVAGPAGELLSALAFELNRQSGRYGRLAFPRLVTGRLAVDQALDGRDRGRAREQVRAALEEYRRVDRLRDFLATTAPKVLSTVPGVADVPGVTVAGRYLPELVLRGLVSWRRGRRVVLGQGQDWYGHQDRGLARDSFDVLVDLNRDARSDVPAQRRQAGELLWSAFLADLRNDFRSGQRSDEWSLNCVVLLDSVDSGPGLRFLEGLITARRQHAAHTEDDPDPLTVVATSLGDLSARVTAPGETLPMADQASYRDYLDRSEGKAVRWWYPVMLRDLTRDEVGNMVSALGLQPIAGGGERQVTAMVHRFTGGHPGSTRLVLDAIAERPDLSDDLPAVLAAPEPGVIGPSPRSVESRLREELLRGVPVGAVDDLATCAAARDIDQASRLVARSGLLTGPRGARAAIFALELWTPPASVGDGAGAAEVSVMRPVLRRLLLRELAARPAGSQVSWQRVHDWFRRDACEDGDLTGELYHALSLGEVEYVSRRLCDLLPVSEVRAWLAQLRAVTAAPHQTARPGPAIEQVSRLTDWTDPKDLPIAAVARLVAALWIAADPLGDSRQRSLHLEIAAAYDDIAPSSRDGLAVLRGEAERHRGEAAAPG